MDRVAHRATVVTATTIVLALVAALTGCQFATDPSPDPSTTAATSSPAPGPTDVELATATPEAESASPTPPAEEDLPGQALDGFPAAGISLAIIGVQAQEILNLRIGPGIEFESVARLTPDTSLIATGRNRDLGGSAGIWYQVRAGDDVGWVIATYVAELGASRDVTDRFQPPPTATTRSGLVDAVVAAWDPSGTAVIVYGPIVIQDLQVRVDVLSPGDDSVLGARLFVVATDDGGTYTVTRVTATQLCARGASGTGDCA